MSVSTDPSTPVDNAELRIRQLRATLTAAHKENNRLRTRLAQMKASRDKWRREAQEWKWGATH